MKLRNSENWLANFKFNSLKTGLLKGWRATWNIEACPKGGSSWLLLFFELFVAFSLCVAYFFLVRNYFAYGDPMNSNVFMAGSKKLYRMDQSIIGDVWKGRLTGLLLSGALVDFSLKDHTPNTEQIGQLMNTFGLYHASWLLLLFSVIILALHRSLFINLGIFAGLMYNFSPAAGPFFFPWDIPATLFFTLAVLFFERRQMFLMVAAICAGCFFKETVLVCALLVLFARHWKWGKRVLTFAGIVAVYVLGKKILLSHLYLDVAALSMGNATNLLDLFRLPLFIKNVRLLFSPTLNHFIFLNAGTLATVLVLCWRRRFLPYMVVILVFFMGQFMYGGFKEFRIFMQVLPLSLILLSERWGKYAGSGAADELDSESAPVWAVRETFPVLVPMTIVLIGVSTGIAGWHYYNIFENLKPGRLGQSEPGKFVRESERSGSNYEVESEWFRNGYANSELALAMIDQSNRRDSDAINHYQRVLQVDTNSAFAMNNLAVLLASTSDPRLRNGNEAVRLAERACQLTQYKEAALLYTLAAAYAEAGRFDDAIACAQKARVVALAKGQKEIADANEPLLELFKAHQAYHQEPKTVP